MRNLLLIVFGIVIGGGVIARLVFFLPKESQKFQSGNSTTPTPQVTQRPPVTVAPENETGIIEGSLSYPSEGIPEDMTVCAETTEGVQIACTDTHIKDPKYTYGVGYKLEVPEGIYYVYATFPPSASGEAYFSEFVTCGLSVGCPSHEKIPVKVIAGQTTSDVDPGDWYNQSP